MMKLSPFVIFKTEKGRTKDKLRETKNAKAALFDY
jgi:hypothetical protein